MKRNLLNSLILSALATPGVAMAANTPTLGDVLDASGISMNGYVDAAYSYLSSTGKFTSGTNNRVFDTEPNAFNLHQAAITVAKQPKEGFGALVNLTMGKDAGLIKSYDQSTGDFDVTQAYIQDTMGSLTIIAGKFVTSAGAEVINSTSNSNYSRSILFGYAIPFTHTGLRATYALNDKLSFTGGLNNGWDQAKDANKQKTVELGASFMPSKMFMLMAMVHSGKEPVDIANAPNGVGGQRDLIDVVATITAIDKLTFVVNVDQASQKDDSPGGTTKKWSGTAVYANYQITDKWMASLRTEYFNDKDGYRTGVGTGGQKWKEVTLTAGYMPSSSVQLRAEIRTDKSNKASFANSDGIPTKKQNSMGLEAIYKF